MTNPNELKKEKKIRIRAYDMGYKAGERTKYGTYPNSRYRKGFEAGQQKAQDEIKELKMDRDDWKKKFIKSQAQAEEVEFLKVLVVRLKVRVIGRAMKHKRTKDLIVLIKMIEERIKKKEGDKNGK